MKIFGFLLVKNEEDIVAQTLASLVKYGDFDKIFVFDNLSTDQTLNIAQQFESNTIIVDSVGTEFSDQLKFDLINSKKEIFKPGDWITTLDADELYFLPLPDFIEKAEMEGANCIEHNTVQFYMTDTDATYEFDPLQPATDQRKYYLLNYGELRIFKYTHDLELTADSTKGRYQYFKPASRNYPVLHFQYRSRHQIKRRAALRIENNIYSNNWGHVNSINWKDYFVPSRHLHLYHEGYIQTGLPINTNLYKVRNNPAYTMANLIWMRRRGHLTRDQDDFFNTNRLLRIVKKYI
jgi:glycosyltransferase involved in cell wall biosynthesis